MMYTNLISKQVTTVFPGFDKKKTIEDLQSMTLLTGSFYILTNMVQRFAGFLKIHSGKPYIVTSAIGLNLYVSIYI